MAKTDNVAELLSEYGDRLETKDPEQQRKLVEWALETKPAGEKEVDEAQVEWVVKNQEEVALWLNDDDAVQKVAASLEYRASRGSYSSDESDSTIQQIRKLYEHGKTDVLIAILAKTNKFPEEIQTYISKIPALPRPSNISNLSNALKHDSLAYVLKKQCRLEEGSIRPEHLGWLEPLPREQFARSPQLAEVLAYWRITSPDTCDFHLDDMIGYQCSKKLRHIASCSEYRVLKQFEGRDDLLPFIGFLEREFKVYWYSQIKSGAADIELQQVLISYCPYDIIKWLPALKSGEDTRSVVSWFGVLPFGCIGGLVLESPRVRTAVFMESNYFKKQIASLEDSEKRYVLEGLSFALQNSKPDQFKQIKEVVAGIVDDEALLAWKEECKSANEMYIYEPALLMYCSSCKELQEEGVIILKKWFKDYFLKRADIGFPSNLPVSIIEDVCYNNDDIKYLLSQVFDYKIAFSDGFSDFLSLVRFQGLFLDSALPLWIHNDNVREKIDCWLSSEQADYNRRIDFIEQLACPIQLYKSELAQNGYRTNIGLGQKFISDIIKQRQDRRLQLEKEPDPNEILQNIIKRRSALDRLQLDWSTLSKADYVYSAQAFIRMAESAFETGQPDGVLEAKQDGSIPVLLAIKHAYWAKLEKVLQKEGLDGSAIIAHLKGWISRDNLKEALIAGQVPEAQHERILDKAGDESLPRLCKAILRHLPKASERGESWEQTYTARLLEKLLFDCWHDQPALLARAIAKVLESYRYEFTGPLLPWLRGLLFALGKLREPVGKQVTGLLTEISKDEKIPEDIRQHAHTQRSLFASQNIDIQRQKDKAVRVAEALFSLKNAYQKLPLVSKIAADSQWPLTV